MVADGNTDQPVEGSAEWYFTDLSNPPGPPALTSDERMSLYAMRLAAFTMLLIICTVFGLLWKWIF